MNMQKFILSVCHVLLFAQFVLFKMFDFVRAICHGVPKLDPIYIVLEKTLFFKTSL